MVVYTELHADSQARYDEYWKLPAHRTQPTIPQSKKILRQRNYYLPKSAIRKTIRHAFYRCDAGLPVYDGYGVPDLALFCVQRKLLPPDSVYVKRDRLVGILEAADENATFYRFMDLPPELRAHVFALHFGSYPFLTNPAQPPISQVSRLMREESLPIFYNTCAIYLEMSSYHRDTKRDKHIHDNFLNNIPDEHLKMMHRLRIRDYLNHRVGLLNWDKGKVSFWCRDVGSIRRIEPGTKLRRLRDQLQNRAHGKGLTRADVNEIQALMEANRKEEDDDDE